MPEGLNEIGNVDCNFVGEFGNFTVRNYGENGTTLSIESLEENAYNEAVGADGTMTLNKSNKPRNKKIVLNVRRSSADYSKMQKIVALEEAGKAVIFSAFVVDNNSGESYASTKCVLKTIPPVKFGPDPDHDAEYTILMASVVHVPPTKY